MDAAFHLAAAAPAAGTRIFARHYTAGAGQAADRGKAFGDQGMGWNLVRPQIIDHLGRAPAGQRIDLDSITFRLEQRERGAGGALETFAPGDPGIEAVERA